jgi:hypothetical protein
MQSQRARPIPTVPRSQAIASINLKSLGVSEVHEYQVDTDFRILHKSNIPPVNCSNPMAMLQVGHCTTADSGLSLCPPTFLTQSRAVSSGAGQVTMMMSGSCVSQSHNHPRALSHEQRTH